MTNKARNILIFLGLTTAIVGGAGWYFLSGDTAELDIAAVSGPSPVITAPRKETFPTINVADIKVWAEGEAPTAAQGLSVVRFAEGLDHPRSMLVLPNGDVLVAETNSPPRENKGIEGFIMRMLMNKAGAGVPSANRISLLRDADGDGRAESKTVLLDGLNSPYGMQLVGDTLYVANTDAVMAYPYTAGQVKVTGAGRKIVDLPASKPNNHWTRNLLANEDGSKLYVAIGSATNVAEKGLEVERGRARIIEIDLATGRKRDFAVGLRNPVGLAWEPNSDALWTVVNERDMLGSDLVPDYLTRVEVGLHFGWPWNYWGGYEDFRVEPRRQDLREYTRRPDYALGSHVAPLGLTFASNAALGGSFTNGAFVALHGSWNRKPASGYKVVFVPFGSDGQPAVTRNAEGRVTGGLPVDVLSGFLGEDGSARGRPTDVTIDSRGALLVTDDVAGIIWRVSNPAMRPRPVETASR
ncbi:PQQ-dependent sugar dehydrogenase [Blastomonas aquatica]|uniref:Sorbosone dehydrogenase n=1 Tax=Blastomonas aquatica TaxID=1510276 RepID=A0ABQ1J184_9SPHN|nr:sorbosone dehydrogenase family protein [Blastomonas aquatica]GGB57583.1 sorbosone dehydrogenase [Blastomonas aquatica]